MGVLKDPPGTVKSPIENYGIGLVSEGIHSRVDQHNLKTPYSTFHTGSGYKGVEFENVIKAINAGTYIDLETRGLNPVSDPPFLATAVGPGTPRAKAEYLDKIGLPLFSKTGGNERVDYDYLARELFGLESSRPVLQEGLSEDQAISRLIESMGDVVRPMVYESRPVPLEESSVFKKFVEQSSDSVKNDNIAGQIAAFFDPAENPTNIGLYRVMDGEEGIIKKATSDVITMTGQKASKTNVDRVRKNIMRHLYTNGGGMDWERWMQQTFDAAQRSGNTIIAHNLNFESRMAAGRTSEDFYNLMKERYLHSFNEVKKSTEDIYAHRVYTTSSALHNAKFDAVRQQSFDAWSNVFDEWTKHAAEETSKVKLLDSMDLGRSVFGMAQEQLGRKGLYNWRNTQHMSGLSLQYYVDALAKYHEDIGDPLPEYLKKEYHRSTPDALLTRSYVEDMLHIGRKLKEGNVEELNQRHKTILQHLGKVNADPMTKLNSIRDQILQDVGTIIEGGEVEIRDWDPDNRNAPYITKYTQEWDENTGKWIRRERKINTYKRRKTKRIEEVIDYQISGFNSYVRDHLTSKEIDRFRQSVHFAARELKESGKKRPMGNIQKMAEEFKKLDAFNMDKSFTPEETKRFIKNIEIKSYAKSASHHMGHTGKVFWATAGFLGGAAAMRTFMGSEAEHYMNQLYSKNTEYEQDKGVMEIVDVPASMGVGMFGGATLAATMGPGQQMTLSKSARQIMQGKNIGKHLPYLAAGALALTSTLHTLKSNASDVVNAEPSGGHPFQIGGAALGAAAMTAMAYGKKYGFSDDMFASRLEGEPRVIDKLANLTGLSFNSTALNDTDKALLYGGRTFDPILKWTKSSVLDPSISVGKTIKNNRYAMEAANVLGRYKATGAVIAGVGMLFGGDYLFGKEDQVVPANNVSGASTEKEGFGEYGYSENIRKQKTPFGSPLNLVKNTQDAFSSIFKLFAEAKSQDYIGAGYSKELYEYKKRPFLIENALAAHHASKPRQLRMDSVPAKNKKWVDTTQHADPQSLLLTKLDDVNLTVPGPYVKNGILTDMPIPEQPTKFNRFSEPNIPDVDFKHPNTTKPLDDSLFESKGSSANITKITEAHAEKQRHGNKYQRILESYRKHGDNMVNFSNAEPPIHNLSPRPMHRIRQNVSIKQQNNIEHMTLQSIMNKDHAIRSNRRGSYNSPTTGRKHSRVNKSNGHLTGV